MERKEKILLIGLPLFVVLVTFLLSLSAVGTTANNYLEDHLYTSTSPDKGVCIVIGIDDYALSEYGAWPWTRDKMADVIDLLNQDPDAQPAAIGVDVIYAGTSEEYADDRLAQSIAQSDNVVLAASANFDAQLTQNQDGIYVMDSFQIASMDFPNEMFDAMYGHVNAMYDDDGILRHHLWSYQYNGETVYSMPYQLYTLWCEENEVEADFEPYTDSNGFWWIEYSREPGDYYTYSIADILQGNYDPDVFTDAVVLIGIYEASSMDYFITSADRAQRMYGVEYLANVTDAIISNNTKQHITKIFLFFCGILLVGYTYFLLKKNILVGLIAWLVSMGATYVGYLVAFQCGYLLEPLQLWVGYTLGLIVCIIYHYSLANKRRKYITDIFSRYVDSDIIKQLLKEDSESLGLEGKECNIAVMFIDIRGFTTLSEKLSPIEVVRMLNKYLTLTSSCIKRNGGVVDKFIGDATMAFWGAPLPCEDSVYQACKAALEMAEKSKEIDTGGAGFGIGIHYGPAIVGNIGAVDRMDFTAIGDTVNTTERIESKAPLQTVYVSELVAQMLEGRAITKPLEEKLMLKGKSEPMQIYILEQLL
ncbi:MAG: adenylate/guanylate cyclase domain-containing protein [Faecalibacterium sp.]